MDYKNRNKDQLDDSDINYSKDINDMQKLMNNYKNENRSAKKKIPEAQQQQYPTKNQYELKKLEDISQQQFMQIKQLESTLQKEQSENSLQLKKIKDLEGEILQMKNNVNKAYGNAQWKVNQMDDLNYRYHELGQAHSEFLDNARNNAFILNKEKDFQDRRIKELEYALEERSNKLKIVSVTQEKNLDKCLELDKKLRMAEEEIAKLQATLQQREMDNDVLQLNKKAEGTFMVEVEHLRSDVKRLVGMLRTTEEFKEFADIADDSGSSIRFLKGIKIKSYVDLGCNSKCKNIKPCQHDSVIDEKVLWVPEEAYKFAHEFRLKYQGELTDTLIEKLLFELNKIWSQREERLIQRVKANCAAEISSLRRQLAYNPRYDEQQAKSTIHRLKQELKQAYKENREAYAQRADRNPPGVKYINEAMKMKRDVNHTKQKCKEQNQLLKQKLAENEQLEVVDNNKKVIFHQGAQWISNKIVQLTEQFSKQFGDLVNKFELNKKLDKDNKIGASGFEGKNMEFLLIQEVDKIINDYKSKISWMKENSDKDMISASEIVNQACKQLPSYIDTF